MFQIKIAHVRTVAPCLAAGVGSVGATLVAGQVDERELAMQLAALAGAEDDLEDGVRAGRVLVGRGGALGARLRANGHQPRHFVHVRHRDLGQTHDLHHSVAVLQDAQLLVLAQQIKDLRGT